MPISIGSSTSLWCSTTTTLADNSGVVDLSDSNAEQFKDDVELYIVTRRVQGCDLGDFYKKAPDVTVAARVVIRILEVLKECHLIDVLHRDLKPEQLILQGEDPSRPVLIDFGLAFHEEAKGATNEGDGVGNRFIVLPEQLSGGASHDKQDYRSDITQCVGLMYFLVTGRDPGNLVLHKPHVRDDLTTDLCDADAGQVRRLTRIFDVGFELSPERRWQSIDSLIATLTEVAENSDSAKIDFALRLDELNRIAESAPDLQLRNTSLEFINKAKTLIDGATRIISQKFDSRTLTVVHLGNHDESLNDVFTYIGLWRIALTRDPSCNVGIMFSVIAGQDCECRATLHVPSPTNLVMLDPVSGKQSLASFEDGVEIQHFRLGIFDPDLPRRSETLWETSWTRAIERLLT